MPEKDPTLWSIATWWLVAGCCFIGGVTSWYKRIKEGHTRAFNIVEFIGEMFTAFLCGFVGFISGSHFFADDSIAAGLGGVSAHFATRLLFSAEGIIEASAKVAAKKIERYGK